MASLAIAGNGTAVRRGYAEERFLRAALPKHCSDGHAQSCRMQCNMGVQAHQRILLLSVAATASTMSSGRLLG